MTEERKPFYVDREKLREMILGKINHPPYSVIMSTFSSALLHTGDNAAQVRLAILESVAVALGVMSYCCSPKGKEERALEILFDVAKAAAATALVLEHSIGGNKYEQ